MKLDNKNTYKRIIKKQSRFKQLVSRERLLEKRIMMAFKKRKIASDYDCESVLQVIQAEIAISALQL